MAAPVRAVLALAIACGLFAFTPGSAWACTCKTSTTAEHVQRAGTVLDGTVEWRATNGLETTYSVKVDHVYKGKAAAREKLVGSASEAACGLGDLATEQKYLFFVDGEHPGSMRVDSCGGSVRYQAGLAQQVTAITGDPTGPTEIGLPLDGPVDQDPIEGTHWTTIVLTGLAVAAALGGLLWFGRRRGA